ncbi:MAG: fatty acid desaturase [Granulosicoccus sp.]
MTIEVITPITQALREGALTRSEMKLLMRRSDRPALLRLLAWFVLLGFTGSLISLARDSVLFVPAMFLHGVVLVHHFSLQHECCHYTAFKTRWLNDLAGNFCALVIMLPHQFFRYEHCDHHTHTQVKGKDTELIDLPGSIAGYLWYLSSIPYWKTKFSELGRHAAGHLSEADKQFVPVSERKAIIAEARWMLAFYVSIVLVCVIFRIDEPLWYWLVPVLLGEPVMRAIRMTEHVGRPTVGDMRVNTRSNRIGPALRFLCWNNNYHAEHHYASSVPFHALPALSKKLGGFIHTEKGGYLGAHRDIVDQLRGSKPRCD